MAFQPPAWHQPPSYDFIPRSIDAIFNQYQISRQNAIQNEQLNNQRTENMLKYGVDLSQVTPEMRQQAMAGPNMPVQVPQAAPQPGQAGYGVLAPAKTEMRFEDPTVQRLHDYIQAQTQAQQTGAQMQQLGLQEKAASTQKTTQEAEQLRLQNELMSGTSGGGSLASRMVQAVRAGKATTSQIAELAGRNQPLRTALINEIVNQGVDVGGADIAMKSREQSALFATSKDVQTKVAEIDAAVAHLDELTPLADKVGRTGWQAINSMGITAAAKSGDREANRLLTTVALAQGAKPDAQDKIDRGLLNAGKTKDQLKDSVEILKNDLLQQKASLLKQKMPTAKTESKTPSLSAPPQQGAVMKTLRGGKPGWYVPVNGGWKQVQVAQR